MLDNLKYFTIWINREQKANIMPAGAPRTVSFQPDEMIQLGKEMVKWVEENDPLHLSQWYSIHMGIKYSDWDTMSKRPEFVQYYEQAMRMIGIKYLDKNSNVREGISQRWQRLYFKDLKDEEDETKRFESNLKKEADRENNTELLKLNEDFNNYLNDRRKKQSD